MALSEFVRSAPGLEFGVRTRNNRFHIDVPLLILLLILIGFGLVVLYSASGGSMAMVIRQAIRFGVALVGMFIVAQFDPRFFQRWGPIFYVLGLCMLIAVLTVGKKSMGAQRWLDLPLLPAFQPSEIMKLALPMVVAWYLTRGTLPPKAKHLVVAMIAVFIPAVLIVQQPDLGTSLLITASGLFVIFLAGISWRWIIGAFLGVVALVPVLWIFVMREYQKQRVLTLFNPDSDRLGAGWNINQSKIAIGSGGFQGKGFMDGTQSQLDFLPESHTDFIIAVLAEELGFMGVVILLAIYLAITARGLMISVKARDSFGRLLAGSITLTFFIYVFVNIGMVSGILPVVGVPLPLVSYGGTSIVTLLAGIGLLMSIATHHKI